MKLKKQDRNGSRTPADIERKYKLGTIEKTEEEVEEIKKKMVVDSVLSATSTNPVQNKVITKELGNKVTKVTGKDLSTNDFTDDYKQQVEDNTELRHIHNNMTLLQSYEQTEDNLRDAVSKRHTHSNKSVLDKITSTEIDKWNNNGFTDDYKQQVEDNTELRHFHNNMTLLQSYEQTEDNLRDAVSKRHTHSNKTVLDNLTQTVINNSHSHSNKTVLDNLTQTVINNSHSHSNKSTLDGITSTNITNWNRASTKATYNLSSYKVSALTILRSSCVKKDDRVVISFVGTISMNANTTTVLFNLPEALRPSITKDFVVFGQSSNTDGYVGYGYITEGGSLQVRFNQAISSYIRFSCVYDLD